MNEDVKIRVRDARTVTSKEKRLRSRRLRAVREELERQGFDQILSVGAEEEWLDGWIARGWHDANGFHLDDVLTAPDGEEVERWKLILRAYAEGFEIKD